MLCEGESVCSGLEAALGDWTGLGDSWRMSGWLDGPMGSLRLGLPGETTGKEKTIGMKSHFPSCPPESLKNTSLIWKMFTCPLLDSRRVLEALLVGCSSAPLPD